jgi:hypothetical protein
MTVARSGRLCAKYNKYHTREDDNKTAESCPDVKHIDFS